MLGHVQVGLLWVQLLRVRLLFAVLSLRDSRAAFSAKPAHAWAALFSPDSSMCCINHQQQHHLCRPTPVQKPASFAMVHRGPAPTSHFSPCVLQAASVVTDMRLLGQAACPSIPHSTVTRAFRYFPWHGS